MVKFDVFIISRNSLSHHIITKRATQQVDLNPMGPPLFWRKYFVAKLYVCVWKMASTAFCMTWAVTILFSVLVRPFLRVGNSNWS